LDQPPGAPPPPEPPTDGGSPSSDLSGMGKKVAGARGFDLLLLVAGSLFL